jgi:hypothetical protein
MKPEINVTTELMARCLVVLQNAEGPATAAWIAGMLDLGGNHETKRRSVRAIIARLREHGHWIVGANPAGYQLTRDEAEWIKYTESRSIDGKRIIGEASRQKQAVIRDASGQGLLFTPNHKEQILNTTYPGERNL